SAAARRMSSSRFGASCGIEHLALLIDGLEEVRIADGAGHDQIDLSLEDFLQFLAQVEVTREGPSGCFGQKLDEEIQLAARRSPGAVGRRAEHFQRLHSVLAAQLCQLSAVLFDKVDHARLPANCTPPR